MRISFSKKLNQVGLLSLHTLIPIVLAIVVVGGVGAYVITKSKAMLPSDGGGYSTAWLTCSYTSSISKPVAGKTFSVKVSVKNIGSKTFTDSNKPQFVLNAWSRAGEEIANPVLIGSIAPGATKSFTLSGVVPKTNNNGTVTKVEASAHYLFLPGKTTNASSNCQRKTWLL